MKTRVIVVTGANGGLGQAIAKAFLEESPGNLVWLTVHARRDRVDALAAEHPERCRIATLDVAQAAAWAELVSKVQAQDGRLDVLVNNAGMHDDALLAMMKPESWRSILSVNLDGIFHGCQAVLPVMIHQRSGRIINISSLSALLAPAGQTNYAAAKAGAVALTQSLAKEVARLGITVNVLCPGYLETEAVAGLDAAAREQMLQRIPMRRLGRPEEVAAAVRFLACAEASYITGSTLKIDGGIF